MPATAYTLAEIRNGTGWSARTRFLPITLDEHEPIGEYRPAYNGHPNRETWNAALWIDNDAGTYETAREMVRDALASDPYPSLRAFTGSAPEDPDTIRRAQLSRAGDALRDWYDETFGPSDDPNLYSGPATDAWTYAVACVDWYSVADGLAEDIPSAVPA